MIIENDFEFYCYLKSSLPKEYAIISYPSTAYYSEWSYEYHIYKNGKLVKNYKGDFKSVKRNALVEEAKNIMNTIANGGEIC